MPGAQANILSILEILQQDSDADHILPMRKIIAKMQTVYGLSVDRRTVYSVVETLCFMGYDISTYGENGVGYYLRARDFELSEVRLLMDSVYSASFLSPKQTDELVDKLQHLLSVGQRKHYRHLCVARPEKKSKNQEVFLNVELLDEAISQGVKVEFTYLHYNLNKKLAPRREAPYLVNPYQMVCTNEKYYLVCNYDKYDTLSHYRIDMMQNIQLTQEPIKPLPKELDLIAYSNSLVYLFGGTAEQVELLCDYEVLDDVVDKFGDTARLSTHEDGRFRALIRIPPKGIQFWALQFLPYVEVISPLWLREKIVDSIKRSPYGGI